MKIAVATDGAMVATHFGRCPAYTTFVVEGGEIVNRLVVPNPGHEPGRLPRYLADLGVDVIVAGGMGRRAQALFAQQGIETVVGASGPVDEVVRAFLAGRLETGPSLCERGPGAEDTCSHPGGHRCRDDHGTGG